jgi:hypothetical protein
MAKPKAALAWTMLDAEREFGVDRATLSNLLSREGCKPDDDGHFSTGQICAAIYGDLKAEKIGLTRAQRIKEETGNRQRSGELIEVAEAIEVGQRVCFAVRQQIILCSMSDEEKQGVLLAIGRLADLDWTQIKPDEKEQSVG